jgi:hypothetical protein
MFKSLKYLMRAYTNYRFSYWLISANLDIRCGAGIKKERMGEAGESCFPPNGTEGKPLFLPASSNPASINNKSLNTF